MIFRPRRKRKTGGLQTEASEGGNMKDLERVLCCQCAAVYREGYKLTELDSGAREKRKCTHCGEKGYFSKYRVENRKGETA